MSADSESTAASTKTSSDLLAEARAHHEGAWRRLTALYEPLIHEWCRRSQLSRNDIPDVTQEVFSAVWKNLDGFRKETPADSFRSWLRVITRNKVHDYFRDRCGRETAIGGSSDQSQIQAQPELAPDDDSEASLSDDRWLLFKALDRIRAEFEPKTWAAFWRTAVDGQTAVDVASELSVSAGAVRQSRYKVLRRLRGELGDLLPDLPPEERKV